VPCALLHARLPPRVLRAPLLMPMPACAACVCACRLTAELVRLLAVPHPAVGYARLSLQLEAQGAQRPYNEGSDACLDGSMKAGGDCFEFAPALLSGGAQLVKAAVLSARYPR
jgi:hypothetical protein